MIIAIGQNQEWQMKLSSASLYLSTAVAKLKSVHQSELAERRAEKEFFDQMIENFADTADLDQKLANDLADISLEADRIMGGDSNRNES